MRLPSFVLLALGLAGCSTGSADDRLTDTPAPATHVYREVDGRPLRAHVFAPAEDGDEPASGILLFHGGGYRQGQPEMLFDLARNFAGQGMVAIPVQYRLSEGDVTPIEALTDACAAFRWARTNAGSLGLDPHRLAAYGVSAGGHLAASTVTVGCPDAAAYDVRSVPDALLLWSPMLDVAEAERFAQQLQGRATPMAYSPVEHVHASTPPASIVHGDADTLDPVAGSERFCERLTAEGSRCDLHVYPGLGHLLSRNLDAQIPVLDGFDPDPEAVADGRAKHLRFLRELGFIADENAAP